MKKSIVTALLALVCAAGLAQTTVKGHVVNEKGGRKIFRLVTCLIKQAPSHFGSMPAVRS